MNLFKKISLLLLITLTLSACLPFLGKTLRMDITAEKSYKQGDPVNIEIEISNLGLSTILLERIEISEIPEGIYDFSKVDRSLRYGDIKYEQESDTFVHEKFGQKAAFLPDDFKYQKGLLFPGEKTKVSINTQFLHAGDIELKASLYFLKFTKEELASRIYIPDLRSETEDRLIYRKVLREELQSSEEFKENFDLVIFKEGDEKPEVLEDDINISIKPLDFSLEHAVQILGHVGDYWYVPKRKMWAIETEDGVSLVSQTNQRFIPGINLFTLKAIEEELSLSIYTENLEDLYSILKEYKEQEDSKYPWGVISYKLSSDQLLNLAEKLHEKSFALKVGEHFMQPSLIIEAIIQEDEQPGS